jgi:transcriptional regulator of NAD metabolism
LKTVLLLEKYQDKLDTNSKEIKKNIKLFINPLSKSTYKEKIYLKRKVIRQNISILKAKKS